MRNQIFKKSKNHSYFYQNKPNKMRNHHGSTSLICLIWAFAAIVFGIAVLMPKAQHSFANFGFRNMTIRKLNEKLAQKQHWSNQKNQIKIISIQKSIGNRTLKHHQTIDMTVQPAQNPSRFYARLSNSQPLLNGRKA